MLLSKRPVINITHKTVFTWWEEKVVPTSRAEQRQ